VGTWNARTLYAPGQLGVLLHQLGRVRWSVIGLSEVRWPGEGEINKDGYKIIYSGRQGGGHQQGVAVVLRGEAMGALIGYRTMGPRMMKARFHTASGKATIVQVDASTTGSTE